jgi:mannan endo-1,4-beta-mannosidase
MEICNRILSAIFILSFCSVNDSFSQNYKLVDKNATAETKALFANLKKLSKKYILFGHQHATAYGHGWYGDSARSDVKSVCGSHPAVIGVDFGGVFCNSDSINAKKTKEDLSKNVIDTYNRGGISTASWHFPNPVSKGDFYWNDSVSLPAVKYIIPGGKAHEKYKGILKKIGDWTNGIKGKDGKLVPIIFRPYHEFDGEWFWWGKTHCSKEEFISLWKFTISYLRDSLNVHNFIYAFSPDVRFNTEKEYLDRYPGVEWVDLVGFDDYADFGRDGYHLDRAVKKLKIISDYANKTGKLAALTETGLESISNANWWTGTLLKTVKSKGLNLAYVLIWRNDAKSPTHYYAPFPGQISAPDFIKFYNDPFTLFENDLSGMYILSKQK